MHRKTLLGLAGVVGIWLTAGLALPFVNVLTMFTPEQLMVFRGFLTAAMALLCLRGKLRKVDRHTYLIGLTLPFATLGLFEGIRHWGAGPTIIIVTATPLVNFLIGARVGRRISAAAVFGLTLVLAGVVIARWGGHFQWAGFAWSVFATVMNGILYEFFARAKAHPLEKCFYSCVGMGMLGLIAWCFGEHSSWASITDSNILLTVVGFAFVGGFLYWLVNLVAFTNLPTNEASVLAQGETPAVIIGATLLLGEHLTMLQWCGVGVALFGAWYLTRWLSKHRNESVV